MNPGDKVLVAMAQERRSRPESAVTWYNAIIVKIGASTAKASIYYCNVDSHADKARAIYVLNKSPETPTETWDAIKKAKT